MHWIILKQCIPTTPRTVQTDSPTMKSWESKEFWFHTCSRRWPSSREPFHSFDQIRCRIRKEGSTSGGWRSCQSDSGLTSCEGPLSLQEELPPATPATATSPRTNNRRTTNPTITKPTATNPTTTSYSHQPYDHQPYSHHPHDHQSYNHQSHNHQPIQPSLLGYKCYAK